MKFNEILRNLRKSANLTQEKLADELQIDKRQISKLETAYNEPNIELLIKLADCFGCTVDYLLGRESEDGSIVIAQQYDFSDNEWKMIKMFHALNARRQALALVYVAALYDSEIKGI